MTVYYHVVTVAIQWFCIQAALPVFLGDPEAEVQSIVFFSPFT